ncbi:MAG: L,D-transpeptidase [Thermoleophilia bacterium]
MRWGAGALASGCALAVAAVLAGTAGAGPAAPGPGPGTAEATARTAANPPVASRPTTREAWTARIVIPVHARSAPKASARKVAKVDAIAPYNKGPHVLLVLAARSTKKGVWYRVLLNNRPNDAAGWIPAEAVRVEKTPYRIVVRIGARSIELLKGGKRLGKWTVAVGTSANPTPTGRFAMSEIVKQPNPAGFFGTYILTLTAHSEHLSDFDGGDGRVALHGTNRASLLGQAVSHGCVRLANAVATRIGRTVPAGAPVDILP